ncbi:hypothetical protein P3S47_23550 [Enterobacter hormaechei]|nr:hypothetical protein [Enterobacter hormaechei]MDF3655439.1 hypothetical protein [Enterobacter hormaechei]
MREILISESAWEEMTCLFAPSLETIIDIINEESKNITNEAEFLIEKAGRIMNMDTTSIVDKISKHIDK